MNYKSGDLVTITGNSNGHQFKIGETVRLKYRVESFWAAEYLDGHDWWNVRESDMAPFKPAIMPQKIVVTTDGKTTLARLFDGKKMVKRAEAKCAPSDTFDFNTGANLAFNRLVYGTDYNPQDFAIKAKPAPTESKPEPVKLYCVKKYGTFLKKGKVYEFDGHRVNYDNIECAYFSSFEEWKHGDPGLASCLIPLVRRPAKVGEYIVAMEKSPVPDRRYDQYDLLKVTKDDSNIIDQWKGRAVAFKNITRPDRPWQMCVILNDEYLVLDGYHGDSE